MSENSKLDDYWFRLLIFLPLNFNRYHPSLVKFIEFSIILDIFILWQNTFLKFILRFYIEDFSFLFSSYFSNIFFIINYSFRVENITIDELFHHHTLYSILHSTFRIIISVFPLINNLCILTAVVIREVAYV